MSDLENFYKNTVSVDELVSYFFSDGLIEPFDEEGLRFGLGTDEQVKAAFHGFYEGWSTGVDTNPTEEECWPTLLERYHRIAGGVWYS